MSKSGDTIVLHKGEMFGRKSSEDDISSAVRKILEVPSFNVRATQINSIENNGKQINATIEIFDVISQDDILKLKKKGIVTTHISSTKDKDVRLFTLIDVAKVKRSTYPKKQGDFLPKIKGKVK